MNYYVLVDKDDRPAIWEANPTFCTVESKVILELADKARPENAPHRWQELVPKETPVGYVVLNANKAVFAFERNKSNARYHMNLANEFETQHRPYTLHEVMP